MRAKNKIVGEKAVGVKRSQVQAELLADSTTSRWVFAKKVTRTEATVRGSVTESVEIPGQRMMTRE